MPPNLLKIKYKNYKVDLKYLQTCFNHLLDIQDFSIKNNLPFKLIGHICLILLSNKVYRNPNDIDIQINVNDFSKWVNYFITEWGYWGNLDIINKIKLFVKNEAIKFASINGNNCSGVENKSDIYKLDSKIFSLNLHSIDDSIIEYGVDDLYDPFPKFLVHNPNQKKHDEKPFIEIKNNKFKIWFYSNQVGQHCKSFIIFYDLELKHKELIECMWEYDYNTNNKVYAYWSSPELDLEKFQKLHYRIFLYKHGLGFTFKNKISDIILEVHLRSQTLEKYSLVPITYQYSNFLLNDSYELLLNNKIIKVSTLKEIFLNKYNRSKDLDDYEVYKYLFNEYS